MLKTLVNSWQEELRLGVRSSQELSQRLGQFVFESKNYPLLIPNSFIERIKQAGPTSPLWKQFVPIEEERNQNGWDDPISDDHHSPVPGIVHRYQNRVLLFPTGHCPVICRYCFRKNELNHPNELFNSNLNQAFDYIREHKEIKEVILSGGDPFILSNQKIESILECLVEIQHIKYLRFHTRAPVVLPQRFEDQLIELLKKYRDRFSRFHLAIHINHIDEIDKKVQFCLKTLSSQFDLLAQTVLLKGVNDQSETLIGLFEKLNQLNIRPYYLHHPDQASGTSHFYLPLEEGRKIYRKLRTKLPGWAIPEYVVDVQGGAGKVVAFNPEQLTYSGKLLGLNLQQVEHIEKT